MESKHVIFNNTNLSYHTVGSGKPILLMHGFAEDHTIWKRQINVLSKDYYIIAPDIFGTGHSAHLEDNLASIENYARAIREIIIQEQIDQFIMIGHSMGGYITLAYLKLFPNDLLGIGLVHSTAFADDENKKSSRLKNIEFIRNFGASTFLKTSIPGLFHDPLKYQNEIRSLIEKAKNIKDKDVIQYYSAIAERSESTSTIAISGTPLLLIAGKHDQAVPFVQSMKQFHLNNITYLTILQNSAHMGMIEEPELVNAALINFVENQFKN